MTESTGHDEIRRAARATRLLRIALTALVAFGFEWRLAGPKVLEAQPEISAIPYALLALSPVFALGAWAYEVTSSGELDFKADLLWGLLIATLAYLGFVLGPKLVAATAG